MMSTNGAIERSPLLTFEQVAGELAIHKRSLERLISCGKFPRPLKIGRSSRFSVQDVLAYRDRLQLERSALGGGM